MVAACPVPSNRGRTFVNSFYVVERAASISGGRDSAFESVALAFEDEGASVFEEAVDRRIGEDGVGEHFAPFGGISVASEDEGRGVLAPIKQDEDFLGDVAFIETTPKSSIIQSLQARMRLKSWSRVLSSFASVICSMSR